MAQCRQCMADITWAVTKAGERIPIDNRETKREGPGRFRVVDWGSPLTVEPIAEQYPGEGSVDHRTICQQPRVI